MQTANDIAAPDDREGDHYHEFLQSLRDNFHKAVEWNHNPLFTTDAHDLFDLFLRMLPAEAQQHYTCNACKNFVNKYGGLVQIGSKGQKTPVMWEWPETPEFFKPAILALYDVVRLAQVTGVFISSEREYGTPVTGEWKHMSVSPRLWMVWNPRIQSASQRQAELYEDYKMVKAAFGEYKNSTVDVALTILKSESLYRGEKVLGVAEWFSRWEKIYRETKTVGHKANIVWLAVATAPAGFAHIKSSMIGTLLDDINDGLDFEAIKSRFAAKMNPTQYQRPQASPSAGNLAQAEKLVAQLGVGGALARRYARLDEIQAIWKPRPEPKGSTGEVFGHLKRKATKKPAAPVNMPAVTMTWEKFNRTVLPTAEHIEYMVKPIAANYCAILTAVNPDAEPIIQWDSPAMRNPFSWYVYSGGSMGSTWGLSTGWVKVNAVAFHPAMWNNLSFSNQGKRVIFILDGAKDSSKAHLCIFPEILKSEFHGIRASIEAYSQSKLLEGSEQASANGIALQSGKNWQEDFRVTSQGQQVIYRLDRWD